MSNSSVKVFIVEDQNVVLESLKSLINSLSGYCVVGQTSECSSLSEKIASCRPDVVVVDCSASLEMAVDATSALTMQHPEVKVIALTVHEEDADIRNWLAAGARGYVFKSGQVEDLLLALEVVSRGGTYLASTVAHRVYNMLLLVKEEKPRDERLSERETEVVSGIAKGLSAREISELIGIGVKTVETYKARAAEKLGLKSRAALVRYACETGLLDPSSELFATG
ncbi:MAG: response regulator transcription factor [Candidatus Obscuribacterales bacterium]|nr:response regulator transcription factor [Candidatus Obscuribacterales bacterium]